MKKYITILILVLFVSCKQNEIIKDNMLGQWMSKSMEENNGTFGFREFNFSKNQWEVKFTLYLDKNKQNPVFTFRGIGNYEEEKKSNVVQEATNFIFNFDKKFLTIKTKDSIVLQNFGLVGLEINKENDITENGISFIESKKVCAKEYDLVVIKNEELLLGKRPEQGKNLCTEVNRPTSLGLPLIKINK